MNPQDLPGKWRKESEVFRRRGATEAAATLEDVAAELEAAFAEWEMEELTLQDAASESGYSYSHIQSLVASGEIENLGSKGTPRIRRCDLPRKVGHQSRALGVESHDFADEILAQRIK